MLFTKFSIKNYKCFRKEEFVLFAQPKKGKNGSGITYIVGANNSGKTTIIEGLSIKEGDKVKSSERIEGADPEFCLFENEEVKRKCTLIRPESYTIKENPELQNKEIFEIVSSRRHWESGANSNFPEIGQGLRTSRVFRDRHNTVDVGSILKTVESDDKKYKEFIALVQRIIPEFTKFAVGYENNEYIEYISGAGIRHKTDLLGDGVISAIRVLLHLYVSDDNPLIIDEPELSLHPTAQKKLLEVIAEHSQKRQIIISTHSPYFVSWKYLQNGATLNRVVKFGDKESVIYSIDDFSKYESLIKAANWQQPFLLDEVAKEIFFTDDNILFLEGQEDVGLLKKGNFLEEVNIFGYGVRGKDNFKFATQLALDLGFKKVCCILDNGESETEIKKVLEDAFSRHGYKIIQWDKEDIRDKKEFFCQKKTGYFDRNGKKKNESELGDFKKKIDEVNSYFRGG